MLRIGGIWVLVLLVVLLSFEIYSFWARERKLSSELEEVRARFLKSEQSRDQLKAQLDYYRNPLNLEKELRRRFNYRGPDEKLLIVVPPTTTNATSN